MRRLALLVAASGLVGWGAISASSGCGGNGDAATIPDADASSSVTPNPTGTASSRGTDVDAAPGNGELTPNPGRVTCGEIECDAGSRTGTVCCVQAAGRVCLQSNDCNDGDFRIRCDEPADCSTVGFPHKCCFVLDNGGDRQTCSQGIGCGSGATTGVEICKTAADCGDGGTTCNQKTCNGHVVRVCGNPKECQ